MQIHSTKQYWKWGGVVSDFPLFLSAATIVFNKCHSILPARGAIGNTPKNLTVVDCLAVEGSPLCNQVVIPQALSTGLYCFVCRMAKTWLPRATLLEVAVVVLNLNISSDLLGGINLFECKLGFRLNLLWELMKTEFSKC